MPRKNNAFDGIGNPLKYGREGERLKMIRRITPANTINDGTNFTINESSGAIRKYIYAGAKPKLIISAKESICFPNSLVACNSLATRPSKVSKTIEQMINMELQ